MKEKGIATAVIAAMIVVIVVVAGIGAYFLIKLGAEEGAPQAGAVTLNTPASTTENSTMLSWSQSTAADFVSYEIYRSASSGTLGNKITTITDATTTSFTVTGLSPNTTYYFTVRVNLAGEIYEDSNQTSVKTLQEEEEQPSAVDFQFVRKITIMDTESFYPGIIFANNHFYVSYEVGHPVHVKVYDEDFTPTGEEHQLTGDNSGNDHKMVFADNEFYLVYSIFGRGLYLKKFDSDWNEIKEVAVAEHAPNMENEVTMDMLLYYADGSLYVGAVVENAEDHISHNGLHIRKFNQDLEFQSDFYLGDVGGGFGSSMILRDGTFIVVSYKVFEEGPPLRGSLIILRYDESWSFIEEKRISVPEAGEFSNEHYPYNILFDNGRYFIAYTNPTEKSMEIADRGEITLKAFDSNWNLLGKMRVTTDDEPRNMANTAHLALAGNKVYVAYDLFGENGCKRIFVKEYAIVPSD